MRATTEPTTIEERDQERAAARQRMLEHARFFRHLAKRELDAITKKAMLQTATPCEEIAERSDG